MDSESQLTCLNCGNSTFRITVGVDDNVQVLMSHCTNPECQCIYVFSTCVIASEIKKDDPIQKENKNKDVILYDKDKTNGR